MSFELRDWILRTAIFDRLPLRNIPAGLGFRTIVKSTLDSIKTRRWNTKTFSITISAVPLR